MRKLIKGLREFKANYFSTHHDLFEQLSHGQTPRVLFITCSDSRIDPNLITQADPGDLFIIRNAGNIIPPYGAANGGEGATLEYAIHALGVEQIVICGHSHCGAMKGLLKLDTIRNEMPLVCDWLRHTEATRRLVKENYSHYEGEELLEITIAENVLTQIENLKTYPVVHSKLYQGRLQIYAWIYHLETGEVLAYDTERHAYAPPQSQISDLRAEDIPPVACEYPHYHDDAEPSSLESESESESKHLDDYARPHQTVHNHHVQAGGWLLPEQSERIYRGSVTTK
jgi:carbonic anhydrase